MNIRGPLSSLFSLNALVWLAMLTGFAALLCLAAAAWFAMAPPLGAPLASLFTGLGLLGMAVLLVMVEGYAYKEAAEIVGCPVGTLNSRLGRGRDALMQMLGDEA